LDSGREVDEEDDGNNDEVITNVEFNADNFNPYLSIVEGTADDEHYKCEEPEIVEIACSHIFDKWPKMKTEFSTCFRFHAMVTISCCLITSIGFQHRRS
jgi:hypothetical protein